MASAASSRVQAGAAKTTSVVVWACRGLAVGVLARADGVEDVALGEDADAAGVRVEDDGRADAAGGHQAGGLAEGVGGADGEDHRAHGVTDEHGVEPPPG